MIRLLVLPLRRFVQLLAVLVLVFLPFAALYTHYKEAHALHDLSPRNWKDSAVSRIDRFVDRQPERLKLIESTHGTVWSARVLGISLSDPLAGAEAIVSSRSFYKPLLWSLVIPLAVTVLLGRVFCGWVCPMNTFLEFVDKCRRLLRLAEIRERDVRFSLNNKYLILAITLGIVGVTGVPFVALFYPPAVISREWHLFVFASTVGIGTYLILAIAAIELFISKRWWCRYICPGGALYSLLGRFRLIRVARNEKNCIQCGDCIRVCQFGLKPMTVQFTGMECTNCGSCVRVCDDNALSFQFFLPHHELQKPASRSSSAPPSPLKMLTPVAFAVAVLLPSIAHAHHILGLPHYSYKENYPQAPTLEYPAATGPYDVLMTSFPGHPVPGERTTIAFYIKNRETGLPYEHPVTLRVLQTATFGANTVIFEPTIHEPTTNQHKYFVTFPADGEFIAELTMEVEGKPEVIPFLMVAGEPSAAKSVVITSIAGLGLFLIVVRAIRIKRNRRQSARRPTAKLEAVLQ